MLENKYYLVIPKDNILSRTETFSGNWRADNKIEIEIEYLYSFGNDYKDYDLDKIVKENEELKNKCKSKEQEIREIYTEKLENKDKEIKRLEIVLHQRKEQFVEKEKFDELERFYIKTNDKLNSFTTLYNKLKSRSLWQRILNKD